MKKHIPPSQGTRISLPLVQLFSEAKATAISAGGAPLEPALSQAIQALTKDNKDPKNSRVIVVKDPPTRKR